MSCTIETGFEQVCSDLRIFFLKPGTIQIYIIPRNVSNFETSV